MSICKKLLEESCQDKCAWPCSCYKYGPASIDGTMKKYLAKRRHWNFKDPDLHQKAGDVLIEFYNFFDKKATIWPMFGTLLGLVRDYGIMCHDNDIDFGFFKKDKEKVIEVLDSLHGNNGYEVIRNQFGTIYTLFKEDIYIDLYIFERTDTEQINQGHRHFYNLLEEEVFPFGKIKFRNTELSCIAKPEAFLERYYGKDWTTPK